MVCGPASAPSAMSSVRSSRIRLMVVSGVAWGLDRGRLERGSMACQPPLRQAATSWLTRGWLT